MRRDLQNIALCATAVFSAGGALANPAGLTVAGGSASASASGSTLNINASQNAVLNWQSFNIAANETVNFNQPSAVSVVWNRIFDANPSQILGHLNANGYVVLMNQNGFYFGPDSCVNAGGFVAAGAWVTPPPTAGGAMWTYQGPPPSASIINYGEIKANDGGSIYLVAEKIENHGVLTAPDGTLGLYAGKQVMLNERPDGRGLSAAVTLPQGSVDNSGKITADAGTIALCAQVVNQNGLVQANSVQDNHGVIELVASDAVNLGANSVIQANGDASGASDGGSVTIKSAGTYTDDPASQIQVRGGANGGNGGTMEISGVDMPALNSQLDASARPGSTGGSLVVDPYNIQLSVGLGGSAGSATVAYNAPPGTGTLQLDVNKLTLNVPQVTLEAQNDIFLCQTLSYDSFSGTYNVGSGENWQLGNVSSKQQLTLEAGQDIIFGAGAAIKAGQNWSVALSAGVNFSLATPAVQAGVGGIENPTVQTQNGDITLTAGHEVQVENGYVRTTKGGNITVTTGDGDVNAGQPDSPGTYYNTYSSDDNTPDSTFPGGIVTAAGGNVTINAGGNIDSSGTTIGALGAGNVSLTAAGYIYGNFYLRNGVGTMLAGADVGNGGNGVTLGLSAGGWSVFAPKGSIYLNEFYNFNGDFGADNLFDYAPNAYGNLNAGGGVQLLGTTPVNTTVSAIYPPQLTISAGAGGVTLGESMTLFPSAQGVLNITTIDDGPLQAAGSGFYSLELSDGDSQDYTTFDGHAATPVHLGETGYAMNLSIAGDLDNLYISSPGAAFISIGGNANNFSFDGQNLSASETTTIAINGDYSIRTGTVSETVSLDGGPTTVVPAEKSGDVTYVTLSDVPDLNIFASVRQVTATSLDPTLQDIILGGKLYYNTVTHQLGFDGNMTALFDSNNNLIGGDLYQLLNPTVIKTVNGIPQYNSQNQPILTSTDVSGKPLVFTTDPTALYALYQASQDLPLSQEANAGLSIRGPGTFQISAHNMNLGASDGIRSVGAYENSGQELGAVMVQNGQVLPGAQINLDVSGDLDMVSSEIFSSGGGGISIQCLGSIDVGQADAPFISDSTPRGIYTGFGGNVTVEADGAINVNGSRIATYNGGNVNVISGMPSANGQPVNWSDVVVGSGGLLYVADATAPQIIYNKKPQVDANNNPIRGYVVTLSGGGVDAGDGAKGFFNLSAYSDVVVSEVDGQPSVEVLYDPTHPKQFFGSGILALTGASSDAHVGNINVASGGDISAGTGGILQLAFNKVDQSGAVLNLHAYAGDIDAGNSGVLGQNVTALADEGSVNGLFVAVGNATINAGQNVSVTALAGGSASVSGGGTVAGTVIGGTGVSVGGAEVTADAISTGGSVSGSTSGATSAFAGVAAPAAQKTTDDTGAKAATAKSDLGGDDEDLKKRKPALAQKVSRVTVILPKKS